MSPRRARARRAGRLVAGALVLVTLAFVAVGAAARVQQAAEPRKPVVAPGVTVAGVDLGGLGRASAERRLRAAFERPLVLRGGGRAWRFHPRTLGARADVEGAAAAALAAPAGSTVRLDVAVSQRQLARWTRRLAADFDRRRQDARIVLRGLRPELVPAQTGRELYRHTLRAVVTSALRAHDRGPLAIPAKASEPRVTRREADRAIVIRRASNRLILYRAEGKRGLRAARRFDVATGMATYPTPLGSFTIVDLQRDPWWYPPDSDWAAGAEPVPPGPGNPLGTRWMGLSEPLIGVHGTPDAASIGYSASHGCVRMRVPEAEWLFERVRKGTPVFILDA